MNGEPRYLYTREVIEEGTKDWFPYVFKKEIKNTMETVSKVIQSGFGVDVAEYELYKMFNLKYAMVDGNDNDYNPIENVPALKKLLEEYGMAAVFADIAETEIQKRQLDEALEKKLSVLR